MEEILLAYRHPNEIVAVIVMLYKYIQAKVRSPDEDTDFFDTHAGFLQGDNSPYTFHKPPRLHTSNSIDLMREKALHWKRREADDTQHKCTRTRTR